MSVSTGSQYCALSKHYNRMIYRITAFCELSNIIRQLRQLSYRLYFRNIIFKFVNPSSNHVYIRILFKNSQLFLKTIRFSNIICIHSGDNVIRTMFKTFI